LAIERFDPLELLADFLVLIGRLSGGNVPNYARLRCEIRLTRVCLRRKDGWLTSSPGRSRRIIGERQAIGIRA